MYDFEDLRDIATDYERLAACERIAVELRRQYFSLAAAYEVPDPAARDATK